jgi:glutathione S-transferase
MRMSGLPYKLVSLPDSELPTAPKGKVPVLIHGTKVIPDSAVICDYLRTSLGNPLDRWLSAEQVAVALAFARMMDESFYWYVIQVRYRGDDNYWNVYAPALNIWFDKVSPDHTAAERRAALEANRTRALEIFHASGRSRHSDAEMENFALQEYDAIAAYLADKPFFMGDQVSSVDANIYGFIEAISRPPFSSPIKDYPLAHPTLNAYISRIRDKYY